MNRPDVTQLVPWNKSPLWKHIKSDEITRSFLTMAMPGIETVLSKGGTASKDFTLHDAGHALRVTELMYQIISDKVKRVLSVYEWAMLLLAAYLHDIGMTPEYGKVDAIQTYLLTGNESLLDHEDTHKKEKQILKCWLAEREGLDFSAPISNLSHAQELLIYYCRDRHNEWSSDWTRKYFPTGSAALYYGWLDDLINICASHHHGYERLVHTDFDARPISGGIVNRRYLAAVLRLADILENDPERVPDVLVQHRAISSTSKAHWDKPKYMRTEVVPVEERAVARKVAITAQPDGALMERAIRDTIYWIDKELELCDRLQREGRLNRHPTTGQTLKYWWDLAPGVSSSFRPSGADYTFINGSFRPNAKRVLELLGGTQLYGSPFAAVREMIQNAFDAVREQVARQMRALGESGEDTAKERGRSHLVHLQYEESANGTNWLRCSDTGVGMSRRIIEDFLLVSGQPPNPSYVRLKLECREKGIPLLRTGQFGIGVLSYTMLGDHWIFQTRRSMESGEHERGWEFETWGIGSFGELRAHDVLAPGTTVSIELKPGALDGLSRNSISLAAPLTALEEYLSNLIVVSPCCFRFTHKTAQKTSTLMDLPTGHQERFGHSVGGPSAYQEDTRNIDGIQVVARAPIYDVGGYDSPINLDKAFLSGGTTARLQVPTFETRVSWCGLSVKTSERSKVMFDLDVREAKQARIEVTRQDVKFEPPLEWRINQYRKDIIPELYKTFMSEKQHPFLLLFCRLLMGERLRSIEGDALTWFAHMDNDNGRLAMFSYPLTANHGRESAASWRGVPIQILVYPSIAYDELQPKFDWTDVLGSPDTFCFDFRYGKPSMIDPIWERFTAPENDGGFKVVAFPNALSQFDGVRVGALVINSASPVAALERSDLKQLAGLLKHNERDVTSPVLERMYSELSRGPVRFFGMNDGIGLISTWQDAKIKVELFSSDETKNTILSGLPGDWKLLPSSDSTPQHPGLR